jgi:septum formation protein
MIILASQSEARCRLLSQAGVDFTGCAHQLDEDHFKQSHPHLAAEDLAQCLATAKSLSLHATFPHDLIIGADQTLAVQAKNLNKPKNRSAARQQLVTLRGKSHTLHSAFTVSRGGKVLIQHCDKATLTMRNFSDTFLDTYLDRAGQQILHCVGSYQIEAAGLNLFSDIKGDVFTIQGLPLLPLLAFLREVGELPT